LEHVVDVIPHSLELGLSQHVVSVVLNCILQSHTGIPNLR
jgi:hypothetical protein